MQELTREQLVSRIESAATTIKALANYHRTQAQQLAEANRYTKSHSMEKRGAGLMEALGIVNNILADWDQPEAATEAAIAAAETAYENAVLDQADAYHRRTLTAQAVDRPALGDCDGGGDCGDCAGCR